MAPFGRWACFGSRLQGYGGNLAQGQEARLNDRALRARFTSERIASARWWGLTVGLLGVALLVCKKLSLGDAHWQGYAITGIAMLTFVAGTLIMETMRCTAVLRLKQQAWIAVTRG